MYIYAVGYGAYWSCGEDNGFCIQMSIVQTQANSVCYFLEQDTLSALLQSTQLRNGYQVWTPS